MSVIIPRMHYILALLLAVLALGSSAQGQTDSMTVQDPRPVAKALEQLEKQYGWRITYEDPLYIHESDLVDVTPAVRGDLSGASKANKVMIPRGGSLSFTLPAAQVEPSAQSSPSPPLAAFDTVRGVLDSYASTRGAEMFTVIQGNQLLHVVPTQFTSASGHLEKITPLLDTAISIAPKERTAAGFVEDICRSLSLATKTTVVVGTFPSKLLMTHVTTLNASGESARSVLDRLFEEIDVPLSWQLFYDPSLQGYVLNIHTVTSIKH